MNIRLRSVLKTISYAFVAGIVAMITYMISAGDNDCLWHAKLGEYIVVNKSIFKEDIFSWYASSNGYTEFAHSWLGSVFLYLFSLIKSPELGFCVYGSVSAAILYAAIDRLFLQKHEFYGLLVAIGCGCICFNPRPQNLSYSLFVVMLYLLTKTYQTAKLKYSLMFFPLAIALANLHGGTILMLVGIEMAFFVLSFVPNFKMNCFEMNRIYGDKPKDVKPLTFVIGQCLNFVKSEYLKVMKLMSLSIVLTLIGGLINPYGISVYFYALGKNTALHKQYISEWQPISLGHGFAIILLVMVLVLPFVCKKIDAIYYLPVILCILLSSKMSRMIMYSLLFSLILGTDLVHRQQSEKKSRVNFFVCSLAFSLCSTIVFSSALYLPQKTMAKDELEYFTSQAYERLYNPLNYGSCMIYAGIPCFYDTRGDLYDGNMFAESCRFDLFSFGSKEEADEYISKYDFDGIITYNSYLSTQMYIESRGDYEVDFHNDNITVYKKL